MQRTLIRARMVALPEECGGHRAPIRAGLRPQFHWSYALVRSPIAPVLWDAQVLEWNEVDGSPMAEVLLATLMPPEDFPEDHLSRPRGQIQLLDTYRAIAVGTVLGTEPE